MPRLELSATLIGAQLSHLLLKKLTLTIQQVGLWSDSTTVLNWLHSDSCRYKVFVGTQVAEIDNDLESALDNWGYVNTRDNSAETLLESSICTICARITVGGTVLHS